MRHVAAVSLLTGAVLEEERAKGALFLLRRRATPPCLSHHASHSATRRVLPWAWGAGPSFPFTFLSGIDLFLALRQDALSHFSVMAVAMIPEKEAGLRLLVSLARALVSGGGGENQVSTLLA